ncbi:MAG: aminotransferase class V-fold PLP-dependent enzyme [Phycisphaerales bacterium]|nr:aminotransferase class V-fold PLP-dependent enzyme [Phycisphaerales bacterium]MCI0630059.1 aminotransferase class V-fold PLP-dependent enzyme [Phycisphaerales bacterium]
MSAARRRLYFDNAATSFPKPPEVAQAVMRYLTHVGASPGRGAYAEAVEAGRVMNRCRDLICKLIHGESADHIVFTLHTTDALNLAIKGLAQHRRRKGDRVHVVTTWMDHNSILRPLNEMKADGVEVTRVKVDERSGRIDPNEIQKAIIKDTKLVATVHGSNVTGTLQPIEEIGQICRARNIPFLVDAAQTVGHVPIDVQRMKIDLLAFPGHKGLLGPLGTGGLYMRPGMEKLVDTVREGGTGTASERDVQPVTMPDKYEPGSQNGPGIAGLAEGVKWILDRGMDELWAHERRLMGVMLDGLNRLFGTGLRLLGLPTLENRCGVFSIVLDGSEPADVSAILEENYGILARTGLHCAPLAHQTMGTAAGGGATRLSLGPFLSEEDVRYAVESIGEICREYARPSGRPSHPQPA